MKRSFPFAVAAASALLLTSCAVGTGTQNTEDKTKYDPSAELSGKLNVMGFGAGDEIAKTRYDLAVKALGAVDVTLIEGDLDMQQFLSSVAAGDPPELLYANRDQIGSLAARGAIIPLDNCIKGEGVDTSQFVESALSQVTFNDSVYGIPEFNVVQLTMANQSLLDGAGLTIEDVNGSDWDAVTAANRALTVDDGGLSVIGVDSKLPEFFPLWAKANGVDLLSQDGRTANLNDPGAVRGARVRGRHLRRPGRLQRSEGVPRLRRLLRQRQPVRDQRPRFHVDGAVVPERPERRVPRCADGVRHVPDRRMASRSRSPAARRGRSPQAAPTRRPDAGSLAS